MIKYKDIQKDAVIDASGIDNPENHLWEQTNGIYYPVAEIAGTLDLTPKWSELVKALIVVVENGTGNGRQEAINGLLDMARAADAFRDAALVREKELSEADKLKRVLENAQHIFWEVIAMNYPEAKTGDFPPDASVEFDRACHHAADTWLLFNHPKRQGL